MSIVAPEKILKELADLWVSTGKEGGEAESQGVLRACSMTLVVIGEAAEDAAALGETIAALMPEHPARAIVIRLTGPGERALEQRVYAQCWMPFGQRRQICCEQVEISCSDAALADLPSVVLPLAVPDLPLFLWCRSPRLLDRPEFREIADMADRLVLDSARLADPKAALERVAAEVQAGRLVADLAWTQLTRWREMLAEVFENRQNLAHLAGTVNFTVGDGGAVTTRALYMAAWVKDALESLHVAIQVTISANPNQQPFFLDLASGGFTVRLERRQERMLTTVNGLCQSTHLPLPNDYLLMREELGIVRRDPVFEKALALAARLAYATDK
jgi:glucose-6-phosphate dehydrogenase assembly protein OpcA